MDQHIVKSLHDCDSGSHDLNKCDNSPHDCVIRPLELNDYYNGFLELLDQLTPTSKCNFDEFSCQFDKMTQLNPLAWVYVMIHRSGTVVATAKLFLELKYHNNFAVMGHIEDVVVHPMYRGSGYGKKIMDFVRNEAVVTHNCYKVVLDCSDANVAFYEKCGFKRKGNEMVVYKNVW